MNTVKKVFFVLCSIFMLGSCASLRKPVIVINAPIETFKYAYISPTSELTSSSGVTGVYGYSKTKSVNPSDVIAGKLIKEGFIILPELDSELSNKTLIVNYGESGRHDRGFGYSIEVTIQFISAETKQLICTCTAEGLGETEADDIRKAISKALDGLFPKNN